MGTFLSGDDADSQQRTLKSYGDVHSGIQVSSKHFVWPKHFPVDPIQPPTCCSTYFWKNRKKDNNFRTSFHYVIRPKFEEILTFLINQHRSRNHTVFFQNVLASMNQSLQLLVLKNPARFARRKPTTTDACVTVF